MPPKGKGDEWFLDENTVQLAAEDRFLVFGIHDAPSLLPDGEEASWLGKAIHIARRDYPGLIPVFDMRRSTRLYNDVEALIRIIAQENEISGHVLLGDDESEEGLDHELSHLGFRVLRVRNRLCSYTAFDLDDLDVQRNEPLWSDAPADEIVDYLVSITCAATNATQTTKGRWNIDADLFIASNSTEIAHAASQLSSCDLREFLCPKVAEAFCRLAPGLSQDILDVVHTDELLTDLCADYIRAAVVSSFIREIHSNSLLVEYALHLAGDRVIVTPYHANATHQVASPADVLMIARPGVVAQTTGAIFARDISEFEDLINYPNVRELQIQRFLEAHPHFLQSAGYQNVYSHVVLERDDGGSLVPDFILEPCDNGWCDILDLKLPMQSIFVGRRDRTTLAAAIHEVVAQLREYAAYFEESKYRNRIRSKYGLNIYKPRLVAVVGRDLRGPHDVIARRALTAYMDVDIMTFDSLLALARTRMLI